VASRKAAAAKAARSQQPDQTTVVCAHESSSPTLPDNVVRANGEYTPAPGYKWLNNTEGDFRVTPIQTQTPVQPEEIETDVPVGVHSYVSFSDANQDGTIEISEIRGYDRTRFNVQEPGKIQVLLWKGPEYEGEVKWYIQHASDTKKPRTLICVQRLEKGAMSRVSFHKNKIQDNRDYRITAVTDDGKEYAMTIEIRGVRYSSR